MIKKYQKKLSRQKYKSKNYKKTLKKYYKWLNRKNNKIQNTYHHLSKCLVKKYDLIAMEDLNIKGMFKNKKWSPKLQKIGLYKLLQMIKYKSEWYEKTFIQIDRFYPSSKTCNKCGYQKKDLTLDIRQWTCPSCHTHHNRDTNAKLTNYRVNSKYGLTDNIFELIICRIVQALLSESRIVPVGTTKYDHDVLSRTGQR